MVCIFSNMALFAFSKGAIVDIYQNSFEMIENEINHKLEMIPTLIEVLLVIKSIE